MRKFLIFQVMILFISTLISAPVLAVESVERNREEIGVQQYEPVKLNPNIAKKDNKDPYVYITKTGKKYHIESCGYLKDSKIKIRLSEAKRRGYKPCPRCQPEKKEKTSLKQPFVYL
jgi:hypothetical protein